MFVGFVGSRSLHLSAAADDINLVQPTAVAGVGLRLSLRSFAT